MIQALFSFFFFPFLGEDSICSDFPPLASYIPYIRWRFSTHARIGLSSSSLDMQGKSPTHLVHIRLTAGLGATI